MPKEPAEPSTAKNSQLTESDQFITGSTLSLEPMGRCRKCGNAVHRSRARITGKQAEYWECKTCHTRGQQLRKIYGQWPPVNFQQLDEAKKTEYFNKIKQMSDKKKLRSFTDHEFKLSVTEMKGKRYNTQYLPLKVWEKQGFDPEVVLKSPDTKEDPVLGRLYGLEIATKYDAIEERQGRGEKFSVTDRPLQTPAASTLMPLGLDKEQRREHAEVIHIQKNKEHGELNK